MSSQVTNSSFITLIRGTNTSGSISFRKGGKFLHLITWIFAAQESTHYNTLSTIVDLFGVFLRKTYKLLLGNMAFCISKTWFKREERKILSSILTLLFCRTFVA